MATKTSQPTLLDLMARATAADLAEIDQQIAAKETELAEAEKRIGGELDALKQLRKVVDVKLNGKPARKKPERKAKAGVSAASSGNGHAGNGAGPINRLNDGLAGDIVACIKLHGAAFPAAIGRKLDRTEQAVNMSVTKRPDLLKRLSSGQIGLADHDERD
jgi:hypothetical protein